MFVLKKDAFAAEKARYRKLASFTGISACAMSAKLPRSSGAGMRTEPLISPKNARRVAHRFVLFLARPFLSRPARSSAGPLAFLSCRGVAGVLQRRAVAGCAPPPGTRCAPCRRTCRVLPRCCPPFPSPLCGTRPWHRHWRRGVALVLLSATAPGCYPPRRRCHLPPR